MFDIKNKKAFVENLSLRMNFKLFDSAMAKCAKSLPKKGSVLPKREGAMSPNRKHPK